MARKSAKTSKARSNSITQRIARWLFRPMRLAFGASVAVVWLCWPILRDQLPQLDNRSEYQIGVNQVVVTPPPAWVPDDVVERVFERAGFDESLSLLDDKLSEKVALAFYTYPWIERLKQVRKSFPARVYVEVVYREPVAMVEVAGGGYLPVDRHGYLLPENDFRVSDQERFPVIRGISTVPVGYHGQSWGDPAVTGAAQLAFVLTRSDSTGQPWWHSMRFKAIIAPRRLAADDELNDLHYEIATRGGSRIVWGRPPSTRHPGELTVEKKIERLAEYHRSYNGFDDGPAAVRIDIRDWDGTKRSLLAAEDALPDRQ